MDKAEELENLKTHNDKLRAEYERLQKEIEDPNSRYNAHRWVMNYILSFGGRRLE